MNLLHDELRRRIEDTLSSVIGNPRHICLIDPPGHQNVGDSAIFLGELDYIARTFPNVRLSFFDINSYSDKAIGQINRADVLLLHGGGNFGDLYLQHHNIRLWTLKNFSQKKIIQLPQSIYFSNKTILAETADEIFKQSDFTLFTRDQKSFEFAKKNFDCSVQLAPDMAFAMNSLSRQTSQSDCFCLLRDDKEVVADHAAIQDMIRSAERTVEIADWLHERETLMERTNRFFSKVTRRIPSAMSMFSGPLLALRRRYAEERLAVGVELLSRGRVVVADRLHAHILSCLLDIPNIIFDSYDGKVSAFYETWTHKAVNARMCTDINNLPKLLSELDSAKL